MSSFPRDRRYLDVGSEWLYSEKGQNRWNGSSFVVGSRIRANGANVPTPVVNLFDMAGNVSGTQNLGDGMDYYGSPALACAANDVCIAVGFMAGIPTGFTGGTYARLFTGTTLAPQGGLFFLASGRPNEDQGVVYQAHTGNFLAQWFRGGGPGFIDTRLVGTDGTMSILDLNRGIGPNAGCNAFAYNPLTRTTLLLTKGGFAAELLAMELGDDGYPLHPGNFLTVTGWDGSVLDYLPSIGVDSVNARWLVTWELTGGGFARIIQGTADVGINPVQNADFSGGLGNWSLFALPNTNDLVTNVNGGVLEFYRNPSPPGGTNQAVVFQSLGMSVSANSPITAQFDLGNSSSARKRITVLLHDADFSDLQMCTFWLEPAAPLRRYSLLTFTTRAWTNATISFYAATEGSDGGAYLLDNVNVSSSSGAADESHGLHRPHDPGAGTGSQRSEPGGQWDLRSVLAWLEFVWPDVRDDVERHSAHLAHARHAGGFAASDHRGSAAGEFALLGDVRSREYRSGQEACHRHPARRGLQRSRCMHLLGRRASADDAVHDAHRGPAQLGQRDDLVLSG